ncbi:TPA: hypothetical protein ACGXQD_006192 [Bacillus cereus]
MYAKPRLIAAFEQVQFYKYNEDLSGFFFKCAEVELLEEFLLGQKELITTMGILDKNSQSEITRYIILCRVFNIIIYAYKDISKGNEFMPYTRCFDQKRLNVTNYKKLHKYYKELHHQYGFFKKLLRDTIHWLKKKYKVDGIIGKWFDMILPLAPKDNSIIPTLTKLFITDEDEGAHFRLSFNQINLMYECNYTYEKHIQEPQNLIFFYPEYKLYNDALNIKLEIKNISKKIHTLKSNHFIIKTDGDKYIKNFRGGFWNNYCYEDEAIKILPNATVKLSLDFILPDSDDYSLYMIEKDELSLVYPIIFLNI